MSNKKYHQKRSAIKSLVVENWRAIAVAIAVSVVVSLAFHVLLA